MLLAARPPSGPAGDRNGTEPTRDNWGPLVVPEDHYFMLGDNRDFSLDSRYWGLIERWRIEGRDVLLLLLRPDSPTPSASSGGTLEPDREPDPSGSSELSDSRAGAAALALSCPHAASMSRPRGSRTARTRRPLRGRVGSARSSPVGREPVLVGDRVEGDQVHEGVDLPGQPSQRGRQGLGVVHAPDHGVLEGDAPAAPGPEGLAPPPSARRAGTASRGG
jgi:hypothetical protein